MISALWTYFKARLRMIGRCPPHRYEKDGDTFPFCLDCGEYPEPKCSAFLSPGPPYYAESCSLPLGHAGEHKFRSAEECRASWRAMISKGWTTPPS